MKKKFSVLLGGAVICALVALAGSGLYRFYYPFGARTCFLPCMLTTLRVYANEHEGAFPVGTNDYDALQTLVPRYLNGTSIEMLAGISGNRTEVIRTIVANESIGSNCCSWVYFPGLRADDDSDLMLLYERTPGLQGNGSRGQGRAVGFVDGHFRQIPDDSWNAFLLEQERLRAEAIAKHKEIAH